MDNFNISPAAIALYKQLNFIKTITLTFGNVLATKISAMHGRCWPVTRMTLSPNRRRLIC
ncbi:MAG: hypothetical protein IPM85_06535 [Chitinophagaceae bacterium]|nr:hypothetical protein [Chitinophagaceae bacterium]